MATQQNVVRTLTVKAKDEGLDQVSSKLKKVGQDAKAAGDGVERLANETAKGAPRLGNLDRELANLDKRLVGMPRAFAAFEKDARLLQRGLDAGKLSAEDFSRQMAELHNRLQKTIAPRIGLDADQTGLRALINGQIELDAATRRSVLGLIKQQEAMERQYQSATNAINRETAALRAQTAAANDNAAAFRRRNLGYQFFDVGQSLALGMNPAMVMMQQGPQIAQMYAGEGGVNAALKDTKTLLGGVARAFGPVAIAAGVAALAVKGIQTEINATSSEMVSFGDVAWAIPQVIGQAIYDYIQPAIEAIAPWFQAAWDAVKTATANATNYLARSAGIATETIAFYVSSIPPAFIVAGEAAANGFIRALNWMVEKAVAGINVIIDGVNSLSSSVGLDMTIQRLDAAAVSFSELDLGGSAAMASLRESAENYDATVKRISDTDYAGKFLGAISAQAVKNARARLEEVEKGARGAGRGLSEAEKAAQDFIRTAEGLAEKMFPGHAAAAEAAELLHMLDLYGDKLTEIQRLAVEARIDLMFDSAAAGVRDLSAETEKAGKKMRDHLQPLADLLGNLFTQPIKDLDELLERVMGAFAQIGQANMKLFTDQLFGTPTPANDNSPAAIGRALGKAAAPAMANATAQGTAVGMGGMFKSLFGEKGGGLLSAGLGGLGMGYETQNPLMGALGGAMQGWGAGSSIAALRAAGGPIGMAVGAVAGVCGGRMGRREDGEEAASEERKAA